MNHFLVGLFILTLPILDAGDAGHPLPLLDRRPESGHTANAPYRPPGVVLTIKSRYGYLHHMYIDCRGEDRPTVLIDVGIGMASASWLGIVETVAPHTRICIYDRSGYGYSGPGPGERTTKQIVEELHDLIRAARLPGPYILVGHSFGGFTARYFAARYPKKTVGLVLVDSSHPDQIRRLSALDTDSARKYRAGVRRSRKAGMRNQQAMSRDEETWQHLNTSRKATFAQMAELKYFAKSALQVSATRLDRMLPLAVITRGRRQLPMVLGLSLEKEWQDMQQQLTTLTGRSWQRIIKDSGHNVHKDAPGEIAEAILMVIARARQQALSLRAPDW